MKKLIIVALALFSIACSSESDKFKAEVKQLIESKTKSEITDLYSPYAKLKCCPIHDPDFYAEKEKEIKNEIGKNICQGRYPEGIHLQNLGTACAT